MFNLYGNYCQICGEPARHWNTNFCNLCYSKIKIFKFNKAPKIDLTDKRVIWWNEKEISICMRKLKKIGITINREI